MRLCLMIEGQEDVTWPDWVALAETCEAVSIEALFRSDHYLSGDGQIGRGSHDAWTTLAAIATYLYSRRQLPLIADYLAEGNAPDQAGSLIAWLYPREPVYGYRFAGEWFDIGDRKQLLEADNRMRRLHGLPERAEYSLDP